MTLTGAVTDTLTFTAPTTGGNPEVLGFTLSVTDAVGVTTTAASTVTVQLNNIVVDAGADRQVYAGQTLSLHGSGSGPGGIGTGTFAWTQVAGPAVTLVDVGTANPELVAPALTAPTTVCPSTQPDCMTDIVQTNYTEVAQYRRSVDEATCDSLWYQATSDEPLCLH